MTQDIQSGPGDLAPGEQLAGYEIQERIGRGGMAVVYRALDLRLGRLVALKVLASHLGEDEAFRQRFMRESRAAAGVDHPHIIPVFEAGEAAGMLFIAMRYVAGGDVRRLIESHGRLSLERTIRIVSQVASALDTAHVHGLVHRDVKPANVLLGQASGSDLDHVYLSDFGLSKHSLNPSTLTSTGQFLGTLDYVAPEQIQGHSVDGRADQYGLACTVVEMLTGQPPFRRDDSMALMWAQIEAEPPRVSERRPDLPPVVDQIIARAMSKSPDGRYRTCRDFALGLAAAASEPPPRSAPPLPVPVTSADLYPVSPVSASPFAASSFAPESFAPESFAPESFAPESFAVDQSRADDGRLTDPFHPDALRDGAGRADSFRVAGFAPRAVPPPSAPGPWTDKPGDWFRGSATDPAAAGEQTAGPGWRANGAANEPVPRPTAPFRPAVDAAWPAGAPPAKRDGGMPDTRPRQRPAAPTSPARHRTRNVILAVVITAIGLCGAAGIAYKLSHRTYRSSLPPVTVTKTIPAGAQNPAATVREYFAAINHHRYLEAWRLRGAHEPYATFRSGFAGTLYDTVTILSIQGNVVTARLAATQTNGSVKTYEGTYTVINDVITATDVNPVS